MLHILCLLPLLLISISKIDHMIIAPPITRDKGVHASIRTKIEICMEGNIGNKSFKYILADSVLYRHTFNKKLSLLS